MHNDLLCIFWKFLLACISWAKDGIEALMTAVIEDVILMPWRVLSRA